MIKKTNIIMNNENIGERQWFECIESFSVRTKNCPESPLVEIKKGDKYCLVFESMRHVHLTKDFKQDLAILKYLFKKYFSAEIGEN